VEVIRDLGDGGCDDETVLKEDVSSLEKRNGRSCGRGDEGWDIYTKAIRKVLVISENRIKTSLMPVGY